MANKKAQPDKRNIQYLSQELSNSGLFMIILIVFRQDCNEIPKVDYATENFVNWIQPEVLAGGRPTIQSDVYSLCALTWETFMG